MATTSSSVPPVVKAALTGIEAAKRRAAYQAVKDHFLPTYRFIGIGSGSTVVYVVEAIAAMGREITDRMIFVPT
jgi:ribose 5-phosphate isomerase A